MPIKQTPQPSRKLKEKYVQVTDTSFRHISKNKHEDRLFTEIGDTKQPDFKPQVKICRWGNSEDDNEVNFSARLVTKDGAVFEHDGKLAYDDGEVIARFYEKDTGDEDGGFEFDVVLSKKPKTNVLTWTIQHKELDFFYQPALTPEEIEQGANRPENVVGSYAVYHKSKKNNKVGGKEYRTGKAFHIYRPYAEDANGTRVWCELNIDTQTNKMTVTLPEDFVDTAVYPVIVDPTFGYTTIGASVNTSIGNSAAYASIYSAPEDGDVTSISAYVGNTSSGAIKGGLWLQSTGAIVVTGAEVATDVAFAWKDSSTGTTAVTGSINYFLGFWASSSFVDIYYDTGAADVGKISLDGSYSAPADFNTSSTNNQIKSIYATYTASGSTYTLAVTNDSLTATGQTVNLTIARTISVTAATLSMSGQTVNLTASRTLPVTNDTLTITGQTVNLTTGTAGCAILQENGDVLLQEDNDRLLLENCNDGGNAYTLDVTARSLDISPQPINLTVSRTLTVTGATLTISGQSVSLTVARTVTVTPATLTISGQNISLTYARTLSVTGASLTVTTQNVAFTYSRAILVQPATLTITGQNITLDYSGVTGNIKYWDGSVWDVKQLKYWNGSTWEPATLKRYNGSTWDTINY